MHPDGISLYNPQILCVASQFFRSFIHSEDDLYQRDSKMNAVKVPCAIFLKRQYNLELKIACNYMKMAREWVLHTGQAIS
jgi:hypothetical protein